MLTVRLEVGSLAMTVLLDFEDTEARRNSSE